jgi:hypothetical protein
MAIAGGLLELAEGRRRPARGVLRAFDHPLEPLARGTARAAPLMLVLHGGDRDEISDLAGPSGGPVDPASHSPRDKGGE